MQDNQLIADLTGTVITIEQIEKLKAHNIESYSQLFAVLSDEASEMSVRLEACWAIIFLWKSIDRRRAVPVLLKALRSEQLEIRRQVMRTLGQLSAHRAVEPLVAIARDKSENLELRYHAVEALGAIDDQRVRPFIQQLVFDETDNVYVRSAAIEWAYSLVDDGDQLTNLIKLLSDTSPDIRFWAAFALANLGGCGQDILPALSVLDDIAAFDHKLPESWGWHVDREALEPLETIYFQPYRQYYVDEDGDQHEYSWGMRLISPTFEYMRFLNMYRKWQPGWHYTVEQSPSVDLHISPEWLREKLQAQWNSLSFDVRPDSKTYNLSWLTEINGFNLLGGLHRDEFALVITGNPEATYEFALWYRSIIEDHDLYFYEWAMPGVKLDKTMTLEQLKDAVNKQYDTSTET